MAPTFARHRLKSRRPGTRLGTATSWSSQSQVLLVLRGARYRGRDWVRLRLPDRPNGAAGWVPRDRVVLAENPWWIDVLRGGRKLVVRRSGRVVRRFSVVVGADATPTPTGLAAIYEKNRQPDPEQFLGTWSLPLTLHSPVLRDYGGGPGRVAIHGRAGASLLDPLGTARSHGCIRVPDRKAIWLASRIPPGTPVMIHP